MAEIPATIILLGVPVIGQLQLGRAGGPGAVQIARRGQKDKSEATRLKLFAVGLYKAKFIAVEIDRGVEVGNPDQGVKIAHETPGDWRVKGIGRA